MNDTIRQFVLGTTLLVSLERLVVPCEEQFSYAIMETVGTYC